MAFIIFIRSMRCPRSFLLIAALSSFCYSLDGRHKGLCLGGGAGIGVDCIKPLTALRGETYWASFRCNPAFLTDLKIGYNTGGRSEICMVSRNDWQMPYSTPIVNNTNGLEYRYYRKPASPSVSFSGGIGYGFWFYPFDSDMNRHYAGSGFSIFCGSGYELRRNLILQFDIGYSMPVHTSHVAYSETGPPYTETVEFVQINHTVSLRLSALYSIYVN
jgi:hypothetical protein